jgi:hypothetical protein
MYLLDPHLGRHRRAQLRHRFSSLYPGISPERLADRSIAMQIRREIAECVTYPEDVSVSAFGGHVVLSGRILSQELEKVLARASAVAGVRELENRLVIHDTGFRSAEGPTPAWTPALRGMSGALAGGMAIYTFRKGKRT